MKFRLMPVSAALVVAAGFAATATAGPVFTLDPVGGAISGLPGQTIGWGFTFFNDNDFALITSSDYVTGASLGVYEDFISSVQFEVIGPAPEIPTWTQVFDPVAQTGVGEYTIDPGAVVGAESDGTIQLTYDLYSVSPNDPNFDPTADLVSSGNVIQAGASIDVTGSAAPEPDLGLLAGIMSLGFCGFIALSPSTRRQILLKIARDPGVHM